MFGIYSEGVLLGLVQKPRYVYKKSSSGAWVEAKGEANAEAIAFEGEIYNLEGKAKVGENAKTVIVAKVDADINLKGMKDAIDSANDMALTSLMAMTDLYEEMIGGGQNG